MDRQLNRVCDLINPQFNCRKEYLIRDLFEHSTAEAILNISLPPSPQPDVPRWILNSKGTYSVKAAYLHDHKYKFSDTGHLQSHEWRKIWKLKTHHRLKLLWNRWAAPHTLRIPLGRNAPIFIILKH